MFPPTPTPPHPPNFGKGKWEWIWLRDAIFGSDFKQGFDQALGAKLHKASKILWKNLSPWAKNRLEKRWNLCKTGAQNYWSFSSKVNSWRQRSNLGVKPKWNIIFSVKYKSSKNFQPNSICIKYLFKWNQNVTFLFKINFSL